MRDLFESFRHYSNASDDQLLSEGRKENVAKRYPELAKKRESLDGESALDVLIQADPSGNQKYLEGAAKIVNASLESANNDDYEIFWGKKWPDDGSQDTDNLVSAWGITRNTAELLKPFHILQPHLPPTLRDINQFSSWRQLNAAVEEAVTIQADKERKRKAKDEEKAAAREGSDVVAENDYYTMIRPKTTGASCYYGQGTKWCISATKGNNYFDEYTSEGKSFYFVFFANLSNTNPYKKIALVVGMDGEYEEAFDTEDNSLYPHEVQHAILQNMLYEKQGKGAMAAYNYLEGTTEWGAPDAIPGVVRQAIADAEDPGTLSESDKEDFVRVVKELDIEWDDAAAKTERGWEAQGELAAEGLRAIALRWFREMKEEAETAHQDDPPGPTEAEFDKLKDDYYEAATNIDVDIDFPYETGWNRVAWNSRAYVDVEEVMMNEPLVREKRLKWRIDPEQTTDEQDEEIKEAVLAALTYVEAWPDEVYDGDHPLQFSIGIDSGGGTLSDFEDFLDSTLYQDGKWNEDFVEGLLDALEERELIGRDEREEEYWPDPEEKEKQIELPLSESKRIKLIIRRR
jgi:hypothetical protein